MKKIILLLIILTTLINVSYASFPIPVQPVISIDTIIPDTNKIVVKETTSDYHSRMQKEGFDIESCVCESCRAGISVKNSKTVNSRSSSSLYITAAILMSLAVIVFVLGILDGAACIDHRSTCSSNNTPLIFYISLTMIFGYSSIFWFIKALLSHKKNKS